MRLERLGRSIFRIDHQRVGRDLLSGLQAAIDRAAQLQLAQAAALPIRSAGEAAHAKAGHRIAGQSLRLLAVGSLKSSSGAMKIIGDDEPAIDRETDAVDFG